MNLDNYINAWNQANLLQHYLNTLIVVIPAVILTIGLASMVAFAVSRYSWRFNVIVLLLFTAGNLLPPQVIITPLYRMYLMLPLPRLLSDNGLWYDQYFGVIAIHTAFQMGFCTFVLSNYMKTIPDSIFEAAMVDGASVLRMWWSVVLPLCAPALAALATLMFTWIYNDFFWALVLMETGTKLPITSALSGLSGQFFSNDNLVAACAVLVAAPTVIVYIALQRYFVSGLTLGSTKE
jgi:multiple sugar transport system permease protein